MSSLGPYPRRFYQKLHFYTIARQFVCTGRAGSPGATAAAAPGGPEPQSQGGTPRANRFHFCKHLRVSRAHPLGQQGQEEAAAPSEAGWLIRGHADGSDRVNALLRAPNPPHWPRNPDLPQPSLSSPWAGWEQTWCRQRTCSCPCWSRPPRHRPGTPGERGEVGIRHLEAQPPHPGEFAPEMVTPRGTSVGEAGKSGGRTQILRSPHLPSQTSLHTPTVPPNWSQQQPNISKCSSPFVPTMPSTLSATCGHPT